MALDTILSLVLIALTSPHDRSSVIAKYYFLQDYIHGNFVYVILNACLRKKGGTGKIQGEHLQSNSVFPR